MGASDNHMNPRRARRELWREMGFDPIGEIKKEQTNRELSPEEVLQQNLKAQHSTARHKTVVEHKGKWYQCHRCPIRFEHGVPVDWNVTWKEVPAGTPSPPARPLTSLAGRGIDGPARRK